MDYLKFCTGKQQTIPEIPAQPLFPLQLLPYEIFCRVLGWLNPNDRGPIPLVCNYWKAVIEDITLWETQQEVAVRLKNLREELIDLIGRLDDSCDPQAKQSLQKHLLRVEECLNSVVTSQMLSLDREIIDQIAEEWSCLPLEKITHLQEHTKQARAPWLPALFEITTLFAPFHRAQNNDSMKLNVLDKLIEQEHLGIVFNAISKLERELTKVFVVMKICKGALSKEQIDKTLVVARDIKLGQGTTECHDRASALRVICKSQQLSRKQVDLVITDIQNEITRDAYKVSMIGDMKKLRLTKKQADALLAITKEVPADTVIQEIWDDAILAICERSLQKEQIDAILEEIKPAEESSKHKILKSLFRFNFKSIDELQLDEICGMIHAFSNIKRRRDLFLDIEVYSRD